MIVTAEPYFAVTQPGNMVVMESAAVNGSGGEIIDASYELVTRGTYSSTNTHIQDAIFGIDSKTPLELFEARNAVRIAHIAAADKYASLDSVEGETAVNARGRTLPAETEQSVRGSCRQRSDRDGGRSAPDGGKAESGRRSAGRGGGARSESAGGCGR